MFVFTIAGLMVIFPMFHVYTPCSVRIFNYSHSDSILGHEFGLEKWFRIEWYQPLEHVSGEQPLALPVLRWTGLQLERLGEVFHGRMASECETLQGGAPQLAKTI